MNSPLCRMVALVWALSILAGCDSAARRNFEQVSPKRVAIVVGYDINGKKSLGPGASFLIGLGAETAAIMSAGATLVPAVVVAETGYATASRLGKPGVVDVADEVNRAMTKRLVCGLRQRGYVTEIIESRPIEFSAWKLLTTKYAKYVSETYDLDEKYLASVEADAILYYEYTIDAYVDQDAVLASMDDLRVDKAGSLLYALSKPPENLDLFASGNHVENPFRRSTLKQVLSGLIDINDIPYAGNAPSDAGSSAGTSSCSSLVIPTKTDVTLAP